MKTYLLLFLIFISQRLNSQTEAKSIFDTSQWTETICSASSFKVRYPPIYTETDNCMFFLKSSSNGKIKPLDPYYEKVFHIPDNIDRWHIKNYNDWIEYRTKMFFSADGHDESIYGDSIAKNTSFKTRYGVEGNKIYVFVGKEFYIAGKRIKTTTIQGPVYVFKLHRDLNNLEPIIYFKVRDDQCDYNDKDLIELMMNTFDFVDK